MQRALHAELLDDAPCGYLVLGKDGTVQHANRTLLAWLGHERTDIVGRSKLRDLLATGSRIFHETHLAPLLAVQPRVHEVLVELRHRDGRPVPALANLDRRDEGVHVVLLKVTERRDYERELVLARRVAERAQERLGALAGASARLSASLDLGVTAQAVAREALAFADGAVVHMDGEGGVARLAAAHRDAGTSHRLASLPLPDPPAGGELRLPGGTTLATRVVPVPRAGKATGALTLLWDRPVARVDPDDLATADEFARLAGLALENARLMAEAARAVRQRDELMAIAGHEFRTPVAALQMHLATMQRLLDRGDPGAYEPERVAKLVAVGSRQMERLARLVDDVLDYARVQGGRLRIERATLDLRAVVHDVVERMEPQAAAAGSQLRVEAPAPVLGQWDRLRLEQVLTNLLSNANRYAPGGPVDVRLARDGDEAVLAVADRGPGIAPEDRQRIFDRFERLETVRHAKGLGLGLYIVREIVRGHGGTIDVASEPGHGATFTVRLPTTPRPA